MLRKLIIFCCFIFIILNVNAQPKIYNVFQTDQADVSLSSKIYNIHYLPVKTVASWLNDAKAPLLSAQGSVKVDEVNNNIWVSDNDAVLTRVSSLIADMDKPSQQILIKAKIIDIDNYYAQQIGGVLGDSEYIGDSGWGAAMHPAHGGIVSIPLLSTKDGVLSYTLQALIDNGHATIVAAPTLLTQNRTEANIEAGEEVPYQEKTGTGNTSVAFKKAVLGLRVTPTVLPNKKILLTVHINQDKLSNLDFAGAPGIQTQQLTTRAVVANGASLVLGGIQQTEQGSTQQGIPFVRHVPIIGWMLSSHERQHSHKQLLVIITPVLQ